MTNRLNGSDAMGRMIPTWLLFPGAFVILVVLATPARTQELSPSSRKEPMKYYADGAGGQFAVRTVDITGSVTMTKTVRESIAAVRIYYIGIGETANSMAPGWADNQRGTWSAHAEKGKLNRYRVEVDVDRYVMVGRGWAYSGRFTRSTPTYTWTGRN